MCVCKAELAPQKEEAQRDGGGFHPWESHFVDDWPSDHGVTLTTGSRHTRGDRPRQAPGGRRLSPAAFGAQAVLPQAAPRPHTL